jgi:RHH-type transcriptional regulator, rel operon repressor / antitoxin RelB
MLSIRLPEEIEARLETLARQTGRTKSYYARQAIVEKIENLEDIYLAEISLERIRAGKEDVISADEMWRDLEN